MSPDCPEVDFENALLRLAHTLGWRTHAERPAWSKGGDSIVTPIKGHRGFPDVVLVHPTRGIVVAELKTRLGRLGDGQPEWIEGFAVYDRPGSPVLVEVWRPADWKAIELVLTEGVDVYRARLRPSPPEVQHEDDSI